MKQKQEKRYLQKRIEGIEGAIAVHQSSIDFDEPCEENLKHRQGAIEDLLIELEAFRHYLNLLNNSFASNSQNTCHRKFIKYLYQSDGYYTVNEYVQCSKCDNVLLFVDKDWNYCPNCGIKFNDNSQFFRKKTRFVEGEDIIISISKDEYERDDEWEYEL